MNIKCPECGEEHDVADERIPAEKFKASCRGCQVQFVVAAEKCQVCGKLFQEGGECLPCRQESLAVLETAEVDKAVEGVDVLILKPAEMVSTVAAPRGTKKTSHTVQFSGMGGEFFRIWIVNLVLTIITFGIYTPWAKVRSRAYFYSHTTVAGEPFEYLADPMIILRGYLLIGGGFLIYSVSQAIPLINGVIALIFYAAFPFLVFKSFRFYAHNSSFKNIRFRFLGSLKEAYITYLALPLALLPSLGLIYPYWAYYKKKYFFENFAFGGTRNCFTGAAKPFYWIYVKGILLMLVPMAILGVVGGMFFSRFAQSPDEGMSAIFVWGVFGMYTILILGSTFVQQYIDAKTMNYCWQESELGSVRFESTLLPGKLMLIQFVNIMAIILSVGLLYPWAKVRRTRYILENLTLHITGDLDGFTSANAGNEDALGEAAMDFFDFEIGL